VNKQLQKVMRADYLDFFRETLAQLEEDFPNRFLDQVGLQGPDGLKGIPNSDSLTRWACVEAWMYTFTREQPYLDRARELLMMIVEMIEKTPLVLWRYVHPKDPETTEDIRKAYAAFPGSGWHIGGFSNQIGYGDCCLIIDRFSGWRNDRERERARDAGAELCDFRVDKSSLYHFDDEQLNNRTLTSARGVFRVAEAFSDHPSASRWREWALRQFAVNVNHKSDEDATGYQSDWFHSILNIIEYLDAGEAEYYTPYHCGYFEHFRDLILPGGYCAAYGDSTGANSAHLPILEKGATVFGDGAYKLAAANLFRRLREREPENARAQLGSLRWIDAYRWADDSIEPEFPQMRSKVTSEGTILLRTGDETRHFYLTLTANDQTSKTGSGHGHVDANAINCWADNGVPLIEDGAYQWKEGIFHNRVMWRSGKPTGKATDYFKPLKTGPHWDLKDSSKMVYSKSGPAEGVPESWHPDAEVDVRVEFLVQRPSFTATRSSLGAQERTVILDELGRVVIFDSIVAQEPVSAISLLHVHTVVRQGANWLQVGSSQGSQKHSGLIVNLDPGGLELELEVRNGAEENLVYSFIHEAKPWFVTVLLPVSPTCDPEAEAASAVLLPVDGQPDDTAARLVRTHGASGSTFIGCQRGHGTGDLIEYVHGIRTDAALLIAVEQPDGGVAMSALKATVVQHRGEVVAEFPEPGVAHLVLI